MGAVDIRRRDQGQWHPKISEVYVCRAVDDGAEGAVVAGGGTDGDEAYNTGGAGGSCSSIMIRSKYKACERGKECAGLDASH